MKLVLIIINFASCLDERKRWGVANPIDGTVDYKLYVFKEKGNVSDNQS